MASIGIIGAGTAGLHLGLRLLSHGLPVTIYSERDPALLRTSRLPNTVAHDASTRARERALGVNHWDAPDVGMFHVTLYVGGPQPFSFRGHLEEPSIFVDYRLYQPRLAEDFVARGGKLLVTPVDVAGLEPLARQHDLLVVATGRAGLTSLFPRIPELSPHTRPPRLLFACLARGIRFPEPDTGMTYSISPGHGEIFESQLTSAHGRVNNLLIEALPGGALEVLTTRKYEDDPRGFESLLLELLREHAPSTFARTNPKEFGLLGPLDYLQGSFTPTVRRGYAALDSGRFVVALGDTHVTNDPISGQGANAASAAAWALAERILETLGGGLDFDEAFCQRAELDTWEAARAITDWTNAMLQPPPPHLLEALVCASRDQALADATVNTLLSPTRALTTFGSPEATAAFLTRHAA